MYYLFLLFVLVPLAELFLLLKLAQATSPAMTLGLVIVTGAVGTMLARSQGFRALNRVRQELGSGRMPTDSLVDAVMILLAGALLLTPGILTDLLGLSLFIPHCRRFYRRLARERFRRHFKIQTFVAGTVQAPYSRSRVIDSYVVDTPDSEEPDKSSGT